MTLRIAENIRVFRKERKMTQEQLAEALGVTVGAVSKWESGSSTPEIMMIAEIANFFETSVDVLLGYEMLADNAKQAAERISTLRNEKKFDAAVAEAEKALQKYPNNFLVTFRSAVLYCMMGIERGQKKLFRRALMLFERSLELIAQNTDERISEWTIKNDIASVYLSLEQTDEALKRLKQNNADGLNDAMIGFTLASKGDKPEEALPYLSNALIKDVMDLYRISVGYFNAYAAQNSFRASLDMMRWIKDMIDGLRIEGQASYLDKLAVILCVQCAHCAVGLDRTEEAREWLGKAKALAIAFDAAADYSFNGTRFFFGEKQMTAFDDFGTTAYRGIRHLIEETDDPGMEAVLKKLWEEME